MLTCINMYISSNNTNKLSPQERDVIFANRNYSSNNTNKLSPQEQRIHFFIFIFCSNNTNKLSPQEPGDRRMLQQFVQIIQINLVLKNEL